MDKMLVGSDGDVVITNDGATILSEMDIEHPAAQMIVEVAETQEEAVGDGTTTAAVLTGELLKESESLFDDGVHPTAVVEGYGRAAQLAHEAIDAQQLDEEPDTELLRSVAESSMTGKGTGDVTADRLATLVVEAVETVQASNDAFNREDIRIQPQTGSSSASTELVEGVAVDAERTLDRMSAAAEDVSVALLNTELDIQEGDFDAEYNISSVDQLQAAVDAEDAELQEYADDLSAASVDVVFSSESIADQVADHLAREDIIAFDDLSSDEADAVARATGASQLGTVEDIESSDLGRADEVSVRQFGEDNLTVIEGGAEAKTATLLIRGGTDHVIDEVERAINDAVDVTVAGIEGGIVPGAGATEIAIADHIRSESAGIEGRQQLAVDAFADAVEALPRTLAENVGLDPIDALVELRSTYESEGVAGFVAAGQTGDVGNPIDEEVFDPADVKHEAVTAAVEATTMIARIDDVISAN
jgi:chaperonin GroEL (HSP60 family)